MAHQDTNRSLERTAAILDLLEQERLTLSEIAQLTGISTSSVHRLMNSLTDLGFVRRDERGKYTLGRRFRSTTAESIIRRTLSRICEDSGVASQFWIRRQQIRLCVAAVHSGDIIDPALAEGVRIPLAKGGSAGMILSSAPEAIASLKNHGWVESMNVRTPGTSSLSVPLVVGGKLHGAICTVMPSSRVKRGPGHDYGQLLSHHVRQLRTELAELDKAAG